MCLDFNVHKIIIHEKNMQLDVSSLHVIDLHVDYDHIKLRFKHELNCSGWWMFNCVQI